MAKTFRATLIRRAGWGNPHATRYERHEATPAEPVDYRGVYERREVGKPIRYRACISHKNTTIHLGTFDDPLEAAIEYDKAAKQYHGKKAILNFGPARVAGADRGAGVDGAGADRGGSQAAGGGR